MLVDILPTNIKSKHTILMEILADQSDEKRMLYDLFDCEGKTSVELADEIVERELEMVQWVRNCVQKYEMCYKVRHVYILSNEGMRSTAPVDSFEVPRGVL